MTVCSTNQRHVCDWHKADVADVRFSNRPFWVKRFQTIHTLQCSVSLAGSRFSSESAPGPFHHGIRGRGGTIFQAALPSSEQQVQADMRTHLIHRPARDIIPPLGGARVSSYCGRSCMGLMLLRFPGSSGTRCRPPICGAGSRPVGVPAPRLLFSSHGAWRSASPRP
jgi:hypothetical protein